MALSERHRQILDSLGLPTDLSHLSDEQYFAIDDVLTSEYQLRGINDDGNGLNSYGEMCVDIIESLPDA